MSFLSFLSGFSRPKTVEGGLYYFKDKNGAYVILKILKIDEKGVHVRQYSNQFEKPPKKVDEALLYMAGFNRKPNEALGMGHIPLAKQSFEKWQIVYIQQSTVKDEELEGYKIWQENNGGYFN